MERKRFKIIEGQVCECSKQLQYFKFIKGHHSWIAYIGYESGSSRLFIQSHMPEVGGAKSKVYYHVPANVWSDFESKIASPGYTFDTLVKDQYTCADVEWLITETTARELLMCYNSILNIVN